MVPLPRERRRRGTTEGYVLDSVEIERGGAFVKAQTSGQRHAPAGHARPSCSLPRVAGSGFVLLGISPFPVLGAGAWRGAWPRTAPVYNLAQWYPRMAVYDDIRGWDTLPYLAKEFYLEYGDFDY